MSQQERAKRLGILKDGKMDRQREKAILKVAAKINRPTKKNQPQA